MVSSGISNRRYLLLAVLFIFLTVLISGAMAVYVLSDSDIHETHMLALAAIQIDRAYGEDVDWDRLLDAGMEGMFEQLDRFSGYLDPGRFERVHEEFAGAYVGIGVNVIKHDDGLMVMSVRENGPAAEVGLLSGDIIIEVDSIKLSGLGAEAATDLLRGEEGTEVGVITYRPVSEDTLYMQITRSRMDLIHIPFAGFTPDSAIYVRLLGFDAGAARDLEKALDSLLGSEDIDATSIILDLRGNPGGLFTEAYHTANLFLEEGQFIVGTKGRLRWNDQSFHSTGNDLPGGLPLAVIVDGGSASSAEIVAGALKQLARATLIGDTTFGKGLVQGFAPLTEGGALSLTISRYYLHGNVFLNEFDTVLNDVGHGLVPDHIIKFTEYDPFPRAVEYSLLLNRFANQHQDEIIASSGEFGLDDNWVDRFEDFAHQEGFEYQSPVTHSAERLLEIARMRQVPSVVLEAAERIAEKARLDDTRQFSQYTRYIAMRLKQIAFARKYDVYTAYAKAIVPERPDIQLAGQILTEKSR
ncbi:MAG: hypothetical protein DRP45_06420 [Candidatus Zixiibacteriota bacterium]|nr:MAG: hypothetical protein DRP45_06420 [candidate division Zixibacteria bacterium]